jgi:adenosylmethionine-8-amino-7-oxononanoate aminotransferase
VALQVSPPFVVTEDELAKVVDAIAASLREVVPALAPTGL